MKATKLRIKLRAYDFKLLDNSVNEIVQTAK
jgi:small subunit ribosomal protein S10